MKKVIAFAALLSLGTSSLAFAQTSPATSGAAPATTGSAPATGMMGPQPKVMPGGTPPAAEESANPQGAAGVAMQTNTQATVIPQPGQGTTVPTMSGNAAGNDPLKGANSFTQTEAEKRLEKRGYTNVAGLAKDNAGVWRGTATNKKNQSVSVALDYKGRITETK